MNEEYQLRYIPLEFEIRDENGGREITGLAAPYYDTSKPGTEFDLDLPSGIAKGERVERFAPGCFDESLRSVPDISLCFQHNTNLRAARTPGSLELWTDNTGLRFKAKLNKTSYSNDILEQCRSGELRGASIRFKTLDQKTFREGKKIVNLITKVKLGKELSLCYDPAYSETPFSLRSVEQFEAQEQLEKLQQELEQIKKR